MDVFQCHDTPDAQAQKNFTDPESRIMKSKDGFVQAYNAQIAVDAEAQIIVAQGCGRGQSWSQARAGVSRRRLLFGGKSRRA